MRAISPLRSNVALGSAPGPTTTGTVPFQNISNPWTNIPQKSASPKPNTYAYHNKPGVSLAATRAGDDALTKTYECGPAQCRAKSRCSPTSRLGILHDAVLRQ